MESSARELLREGKFLYSILTPNHRDAALIVLARAFCEEPMSSAVAEIRPEMKTHLHDWVEFIDYWMDHCSSNSLSVIAMDVEKSCIAGVLIVRDLLFFPTEFNEKYTSTSKTLTPLMSFALYLDAEATKKMPELQEPGKAVDFWMLGVHPDYCGNGIANNLIKVVVPLTKQAGFKYATIEATNAFTSKAAKKNSFTAIHEEKAADWLWNGEPLYTNAKPPHGTWTFWVKDLQACNEL